MGRVESFVLGLIVLGMMICLLIVSIFNNPKKIGFKLIGHIMFFYGGFCFLGGVLLCLWGGAVPEAIRFPMGYANGVVKNEEGLTFVGLQLYNRIQIYDASGRFMTSKYINAYGGSFKMEMDEEGFVNVYASRKNKHYKLNERGEIVLNQTYTGQYEYYENEYIDEEGSKYYVSLKYLYPRVIKEDNSGTKHIIIEQPIYLWILGAPLPAFLFAAIGILIISTNTDNTSNRKIKR